MADYLMTRRVDANGQPVYDYALSPSGGLVTISGTAKLAQQVLLFMDTPQGSHPTDPTFGTTLSAEIGQPEATDLGHYEAIIREAETYFIALAARTPTLPLSEQMDHIDNVDVVSDPTVLGLVTITFTVYAVSGDQQVVTR